MVVRCVCVLEDKAERIDLYFLRDCKYYNTTEVAIFSGAGTTCPSSKLISKIDKSDYYVFTMRA